MGRVPCALPVAALEAELQSLGGGRLTASTRVQTVAIIRPGETTTQDLQHEAYAEICSSDTESLLYVRAAAVTRNSDGYRYHKVVMLTTPTLECDAIQHVWKTVASRFLGGFPTGVVITGERGSGKSSTAFGNPVLLRTGLLEECLQAAFQGSEEGGSHVSAVVGLSIWEHTAARHCVDLLKEAICLQPGGHAEPTIVAVNSLGQASAVVTSALIHSCSFRPYSSQTSPDIPDALPTPSDTPLVPTHAASHVFVRVSRLAWSPQAHGKASRANDGSICVPTVMGVFTMADVAGYPSSVPTDAAHAQIKDKRHISAETKYLAAGSGVITQIIGAAAEGKPSHMPRGSFGSDMAKLLDGRCHTVFVTSCNSPSPNQRELIQHLRSGQDAADIAVKCIRGDRDIVIASGPESTSETLVARLVAAIGWVSFETYEESYVSAARGRWKPSAIHTNALPLASEPSTATKSEPPAVMRMREDGNADNMAASNLAAEDGENDKLPLLRLGASDNQPPTALNPRPRSVLHSQLGNSVGVPAPAISVALDMAPFGHVYQREMELLSNQMERLVSKIMSPTTADVRSLGRIAKATASEASTNVGSMRPQQPLLPTALRAQKEAFRPRPHGLPSRVPASTATTSAPDGPSQPIVELGAPPTLDRPTTVLSSGQFSDADVRPRPIDQHAAEVVQQSAFESACRELANDSLSVAVEVQTDPPVTTEAVGIATQTAGTPTEATGSALMDSCNRSDQTTAAIDANQAPSCAADEAGGSNSRRSSEQLDSQLEITVKVLEQEAVWLRQRNVELENAMIELSEGATNALERSIVVLKDQIKDGQPREEIEETHTSLDVKPLAEPAHTPMSSPTSSVTGIAEWRMLHGCGILSRIHHEAASIEPALMCVAAPSPPDSPSPRSTTHSRNASLSPTRGRMDSDCSLLRPPGQLDATSRKLTAAQAREFVNSVRERWTHTPDSVQVGLRSRSTSVSRGVVGSAADCITDFLSADDSLDELEADIPHRRASSVSSPVIGPGIAPPITRSPVGNGGLAIDSESRKAKRARAALRRHIRKLEQHNTGLVQEVTALKQAERRAGLYKRVADSNLQKLAETRRELHGARIRAGRLQSGLDIRRVLYDEDRALQSHDH